MLIKWYSQVDPNIFSYLTVEMIKNAPLRRVPSSDPVCFKNTKIQPQLLLAAVVKLYDIIEFQSFSSLVRTEYFN